VPECGDSAGYRGTKIAVGQNIAVGVQGDYGDGRAVQKELPNRQPTLIARGCHDHDSAALGVVKCGRKLATKICVVAEDRET
jgi:hypothetical protein